MLKMATEERILLIRMDGIGDAALCIPALQGLAERYPGAGFGAVCSRTNAALFSPALADVYVYEPDEAEALSDRLRTAGYQRAMIATEEVAGYRLGRHAGIAQRVGFWHGWQKPFKSLWQRAQLTSAVYRPAAWRDDPEHEVVTLYRLALVLGANAPPPSDARSLARWLNVPPSTQRSAEPGIMRVQVTAKSFTQNWSPVSWAELIVALQEQLSAPRCELVASEREARLAAAILQQVPAARRAENRMTVRAGTDVPQWLDALAASAIVFTPDSGAAQVAGMLGIPVVDIFEEHDFNRLTRQWRPWAAPSRCLPKPRCEREAPQLFAASLAAAARELLA